MTTVRHALLVFALLSCLPPAFATDGEQARVLAAAQSVLDAQVAFDVPALERMLAPDYLEVSPVGDVDQRAEVLGFYAPQSREQMKSQGVEALAARLDEPRIRIDGEHAQLIALNTATLRIAGVEQRRVLRSVFQFRRIDGAWRLASAAYVPWRPAN